MHNLHSRYNPEAEAQRYLDSLSLNKETRFFILIEPGMGYLVPVLRKKNPDARIIALYACRPPQQAMPENIPDSFWHTGTGTGLHDFLETEIPDIEAGKIKIIEWRPALAVYGEAYSYLLRETVNFIKQADASARTQNQFGRRWFKNFFRSLAIVKEVIKPQIIELPFLITGAGPSLEATIPIIKKEREKIFLLAVSSSVAALNSAGIMADMVIAADGGNWALLHLYESFRCNGKKNFALNLTAAVPSQCSNSRILIVCDGSLWQSLLLREFAVPFINLPQRGTVSAAALDLALALTGNRVYFTGVDLSNKDIQSHARPYSFDRLWHEKVGRLDPFYSCVYKRSQSIRDGGSQNIYASWFERQLASYPKRLFSLGGNSAVFKNLQTSSINSGIAAAPVFETTRFDFNENPAAGNPAEHAACFLKTALTDSVYGKKLLEELNLLLFPEEKLSAGEMGEAILSLTGSYRETHG